MRMNRMPENFETIAPYPTLIFRIGTCNTSNWRLPGTIILHASYILMTTGFFSNTIKLRCQITTVYLFPFISLIGG
ncbi:hypothetical protein ES703_83860 [subsurface metagenome]